MAGPEPRPGGPAAPDAAPTLNDVARVAGVSPMSVSRALRDAPGLAPSTRERVLAAVTTLGYRPNAHARGLKLRSGTGLVGLVVTNLGNPFYSQLAVGVESCIRTAGLQVLMVDTGEDEAAERTLVADLVRRGVDGIVVVPAGQAHLHLSASAVHATPVIFAARPPQELLADHVLVDDYSGARQLTTRLLEEGHRRVAFLGNRRSIYTTSERLRGFHDAHAARGLGVDPALVTQAHSDQGAGEVACNELLSRDDPPTAVFASNNRLTLGALLATRQRRDIRICGFDALEYRALLDRNVTLATYDPREVGRVAGELLLNRRNAGPDFERVPPARRVVAVTIED